jgi:hypothetical protein
MHSFPYPTATRMGILVKLRVSFSSYPLHPASPQAALQRHHPLTNSLFHYPVSTQISQRLNPAWTQVIDQPDLSSPTVEPDLSPNLAHDPTRLTEQLNPNTASLLPPTCATWSSRPASLVLCCAHAQPRIEQPCPPHAAHPTARFPPFSSGMNRSQEEVLFPKDPNQLEIEIGFSKEIWKIIFWIYKFICF